MKHSIILFNLFLFFCAIETYSQVGINTEPHESAVLHIEKKGTESGVLFPQVELESASQLAPLPADTPENTIVFNTTPSGLGKDRLLKGYYIWHGNRWISPLIEKNQKEAMRFYANSTNSAFTFQSSVIGGNGKNVEIFHEEDFNDAPDLFEVQNNTSLKINKTGTYLVTANLGLRNTRASRSQTEVYLACALDDNIATSKVMIRTIQNRGANVTNNSISTSFTAYITVDTPGQVLSMKSITNYHDPDDSLIYDASNTSSVTIVQISNEN